MDELKYAFRLFAGNSENGKISFNNLNEINKKTESGLTDEEMQSMIEEFDADLDGFSKLLIYGVIKSFGESNNREF